jgi:hypothetical protein
MGTQKSKRISDIAYIKDWWEIVPSTGFQRIVENPDPNDTLCTIQGWDATHSCPEGNNPNANAGIRESTVLMRKRRHTKPDNDGGTFSTLKKKEGLTGNGISLPWEQKEQAMTTKTKDTKRGDRGASSRTQRKSILKMKETRHPMLL